MKNFLGNSVLSLIKDTSAKINEKISNLELSDFDFDMPNLSQSINEARTVLTEKLSEMKKRVSHTDTEYVINVPYDRETSTITSSTENNIFHSVVVTEGEDSTKSEDNFRTYIPKEYNANYCVTQYDNHQKMMVFKFPKK